MFFKTPKTFINPKKTKNFPSKSIILSRNFNNYVHQQQIFFKIQQIPKKICFSKSPKIFI